MDFDYMNFRRFKKYNCYDDPIEDEEENEEQELTLEDWKEIIDEQQLDIERGK